MKPPRPTLPDALPGPATYLRCRRAAWLFMNWNDLPILVCGGHLLEEGQPSAASLMRQLLLREGIPEDRIWVEERSRSTYENALYASAFLRSKGIRRIALVTEAYHMLRAERSFRKQGLEVVPAPVGFRGPVFDLRSLLPSPVPIQRNAASLHEWLGLAWYRLRGWI